MIEYKSYVRVFRATLMSLFNDIFLHSYWVSTSIFSRRCQKICRFNDVDGVATILDIIVGAHLCLVGYVTAQWLINNFAIDLGIWDTPIKLAHNLNGTLIGMVHIMLPFLVLPLYAAMRRIDRQALQAAANLGATPVQHSGKLYRSHCQAWLLGRLLCLCCVLVLCNGGSWWWQSDFSIDADHRYFGRSVQLGRGERAWGGVAGGDVHCAAGGVTVFET